LPIIHSMKAKYRKALVQKAVSYMEMNKHLKLSILQGMHMVAAAWNSVTPQTISNCFHKAAFNCNNAMETDVDMDVIHHENWLKIAPDMDTNFEELKCDDLESTSGPPQDVEEICDAKEVEEEEEEEEAVQEE
jgi:centromere protein B